MHVARLPVLSLIALALVACGGEKASDAAAGPSGGMPPLPVETAKLQMQSLDVGFQTVGSLRADESVVVRPEVAGRIERIGFCEGARVDKGQLLFALDASTVQASVNEARVNLEISRVAFKRAGELIGRKLISQSEFDLTRAKVAVDEARLASARTMLAKMELRAPFAGQIGLRQVSVGDFVGVGQELLTLVRLDPIEVDFSVPETMLTQLQVGRKVSIEVDAYGGETFAGEVTAIDPVIDANSRSAKLRAQIGNADYRLRPGQFARLRLATAAEGVSALMLPEQALLQEGEQRYVYVVAAGKAKKTAIRTGRRTPGLIEVSEGLKAGDEVIIAGQTKPMMFDGAAVAPMAPPPKQTGSKPAGGSAEKSAWGG
jgi:membrane fusion protein (multidrug efflux system)